MKARSPVGRAGHRNRDSGVDTQQVSAVAGQQAVTQQIAGDRLSTWRERAERL
jgi:hypothetical protein